MDLSYMYMYILLHVYVVLPRYCCYVRFKVISLSNHLIALSLSLSLSFSLPSDDDQASFVLLPYIIQNQSRLINIHFLHSEESFSILMTCLVT